MPIEPAKALGAQLPDVTHAWSPDSVILYHLGLGAGEPDPTDANELEYAYEKNLKVLPSFATIPAFPAMMGIAQVEGISFNPALLLHGEQEIRIHGPIPAQANTTTRARVAEIYDKGKAALVILESETRDADGNVLFVNRPSIFLRGEGGFGGEAGPKAGNQPPDREPDHQVESPTRPSQALLYRLSGDKNPLHADPEFAKMGGFDKPILHGLCSYGIVCKAVVDAALDGDVSRVAGYRARFAGVVFPGETLVTSVWKEGDDTLIVSAQAKERGTPVISNAAVTLR